MQRGGGQYVVRLLIAAAGGGKQASKQAMWWSGVGSRGSGVGCSPIDNTFSPRYAFIHSFIRSFILTGLVGRRRCVFFGYFILAERFLVFGFGFGGGSESRDFVAVEIFYIWRCSS